MEKSGLRLRLCVIAAATVCLALGLFTGSASAVLSMERGTDTSLSIDSDVHWWGGTGEVTYNGYQYLVYWDAAATRKGEPNLVLTRRRLSDDNRVTILFTTAESYLRGIDDGHNEPVVTVNRNDGTLHISWGNHLPFTFRNKRHYYWRSAARCIERTQETFTREGCGFEFRNYQADRTSEEDMTYPTYITDQSGRLFFYYRNGLAPNSNSYMNQYDEATQSWRALGMIIHGRSFGEYRFRVSGTEYSSSGRGAYPAGILFDKNERMHIAWVWRENTVPLLEHLSQNGLYYAYSDDHGRTWYAQDRAGAERERRIATTETESIDSGDMTAARVIGYPPGQMMTAGLMALDSNNNPHIVSQVAEVVTTDEAHLTESMRYIHMWRDTNGTWYEQFIGTATNDYSSWPTLFFDRADIAYVLYGRIDKDWNPYNGSEPFVDLPYDNVVWQADAEASDGGALSVDLFSELTCLDTASYTYIGVPISTAGNAQVRIRMKNPIEGQEIVLSWVTEEESHAWEVTRQQTFARFLRRETRYVEYVATVTDADWNGTLRALEICTARGTRTGNQKIDWIKITDREGRAVKTWNFSRGYTLVGAEASQSSNWGTWTIEDLLPEVPLIEGDSHYRIDTTRFKDERRPAEFPLVLQGTPGTESLTMRRFDIGGDDIAKEYGFETDLMGWRVQRDVEAASFVKSRDRTYDVIGGRITGADPQIVSMTNLKTPIEAEDDFIHVRLKNTSRATRARVYFITDSDRTWNVEKSKEVTITRESTYAEYTFDMSRVTGWSGSTLYQLRIDPVDDGTSTGTFNIDRFYIYTR